MENKQDLTTGELSKLKEQAERSVVGQNGQFRIQFDNPVQGIDTAKVYTTRDQAVDVAYEFLRQHQGIKAA